MTKAKEAAVVEFVKVPHAADVARAELAKQGVGSVLVPGPWRERRSA